MLFGVSQAMFAQGAQKQKVTGTVTDESGEPLIGVTVVENGASVGAITDLDGRFTLDAPSNATLTFSYVGYLTQNVKLNGNTKVDVVLKEDNALLDEVVVVGYGIQRKSDVTGALTRVNEEQLNSRPVSNAFEALQGKAAGVDITTSERPGTVGSILIRGTRSINASNSPLYVVDGIPVSDGIDNLNPRDIEAIDILKDASSTAIYGSRGANGVVLITTKRGKEGKLQLTYSGSMTFEKLVDKSPAFSASDYITWRRWAYYNSNPELYPRGDQPNQKFDQDFFSGDNDALANVNKGWANGTWNGNLVSDTDWEGFVTQTGVTQEHNLRASGGTKDIQSSFSFGYLDNEGTQKGQEYKRYNAAMTTDIQATKWFKMGGSINASWSKQKYGYSRTGQVGTASGPVDIYSAAKALPHYTVPYTEAGDIIDQPGGSVVNAYTVFDEWKKSKDNREYFRAMGSFYAQIDFGKIFEPVQGLMYKMQFGPDFRYSRSGIFLDASSATRKGSNNFARRNDDRHFTWTLDNMLLYNRIFGDHSIGVTLLHSATKYTAESSGMSAERIYMPSFLWNNFGDIDVTNTDNKAGMSSGFSQNTLLSYMARLNYSFMDRYLLTVSGRYDGASVLAKGNKWAFFPSMALGWRMEQENFLKDVEWLDQLKLRFGVGTTGNSAVGAYGTLGTIQSFYMPFSTANERILITNEPYYTNRQTMMANKNLGWEKTTQYNFGLDFSFLRGRINGNLDIYTSKTKDLLLNVSLPSLSGYPSMMDNIGETKNKGFDLTLNVVPVRVADFEWVSTINAAYQKDEIVSLANGKEDDIANAWFIGESIRVYYGYDNDGLWQESDAAEMAKFNENGHKFTPGSVKPVDQDGNYKIDDKDRVILGNLNPRWTLGWSNTFSWKGIELTLDLFGRFKYMVNTGGEGQYGMYAQREIDYWTPDNPNADWQKPVYSTAGGDSYSSLLGFKDASFIKVRNLSLGYRFDKALCNRLGINGAKFYIQGRNLGMLYSSVDFMDLDTGATYFNRGFTVGLQLDF
ncbi:MAG: TonB-dependent receptor [Prevotella sp.]|nr:TonB-dependent receptor [Prevotella sp.]